mgnify:CR=1 FL=1
MKRARIGGQAVIEGVMMKYEDQYAVAVRKPDQEIEVKVESYTPIGEKYKILKLPILRGVVNFFESLVIGVKTLTYSADFYEEEEPAGKSENKDDSRLSDTESNNGSGSGENGSKNNKKESSSGDDLMMIGTVIVSLAIAIALFMLLPAFIAGLLEHVTKSNALIAVAEGVLRLVIFLAYVVLISLMKDIKRVFMYHGAEHKCINCIEHGMDLTVENVKKSSKQHKRCGTSFLLIVMIISIFFFMFIHVDSGVARLLLRLVLIPVIAGVSYEFIRLAGRSDNALVNILSKPGLWLQNLTTREPDEDMIEVGIASVEAVFGKLMWKKSDRKGRDSK